MAKKELFDIDLQHLAALFKALGHPARLAIMNYLAATKTCITGDISNELPLSRTTINQHLKELKDLNLIKGEINGVKVNYCLNPEVVQSMAEQLNKYFNHINCCCSDDQKCS